MQLRNKDSLFTIFSLYSYKIGTILPTGQKIVLVLIELVIRTVPKSFAISQNGYNDPDD